MERAVAQRHPPFRRGAEIELTIDRMAYGGRGVGRIDGFVVFVPDTAPGDRVRARLWRVKAAYAEADLIQVASPAPARVSPPCPHFGPCGGCVWQHLGYTDQLGAKESIVRESLTHIAGLRDVDVRPILPAVDPWGYRNKMEFTFHPDATLGLHRRGAFDRVVPITACLIQSEAANEILRVATEWARASGLSRYNARDHTGLLRQLVIREGRRSGEMMVALITTAPEVPAARDLAVRVRTTVPRVMSVLHGVNPGASDGLPLTAVSVLAGRPYIVEQLAGLRFRIGLETFFQTNTVQAERLVETVGTLAEPREHETVFDLYCGVGTFSLPLALRAQRVYGLEIAASAVEAARENAAQNAIGNVEFAAGDVRRLLPDLVGRAGAPHLLVLDPPRSGAGSRVMRKVIAAAPSRILYVSCNPTTLASDLEDLAAAGYAIRTVQPLDLFPHTYHVECVVALERGAA
ncbi:MAG TPA: 23S rRNA (uracil(1939)-C(5))-methyltransferase RlmD [bacterium]|nr:23S rRNA (uracil(1939)-C(5))-methyltransferase RlmD [bacterium]